MMDLIGFWTSVSSIVLPLVVIIWLGIELFIGHEVKVVTDNRADFSPFRSWWDEKVWRPVYREDLEVPLVISLVMYVAYAGCGLLIMACEAHETGVTFISKFAEYCIATAPFFSWVGIVAVIIIIQRMFIRPMLKKAYAIKLKVDKL